MALIRDFALQGAQMLLVLLVGGMLYLNSWSWEAVGFTLFLFSIQTILGHDHFLD